MRPLTEEETQLLFEKLSKYIGRNIKHLIDRSDAIYCFRLHKQFVYYVSEEVVRKATNAAGENLISLGTCFGKFTKSRKLQLQITALDISDDLRQVQALAEADVRALFPLRQPPGLG